MHRSFKSILAAGAMLVAVASAAVDSQLTGTWSTKSGKVVTGPAFYNPVSDRLIEPDLTGISYSFTDDGWYEEAYYRAIANPQNPSCPKGIMQWQHGQYTKVDNGSLILTPIAVDGRQLLSDPCNSGYSTYIRYNQTELFKKYEVVLDRYHNVQRLNLYQFDGSPVNPMYLVYSPPQMLPTQTLNPTPTSSGAKSTSTSKSKLKRALGDSAPPLEYMSLKKPKGSTTAESIWWVGLGMTALGGATYFYF
ncbi:hypothetical protein L228DRAFT_244248 [Xylona heveae TC161]|uniref:Protein ROT1 n=1 Tax=Xylona heveae (strain CBS 132557 / TC161) TaxID=1328760 RepID=A0A165IUM8_XYLHT|nr:hypothetical protein L228DRAFT_244248 [Xylona heveae TC161]KZF25413.1 hypothetical protein L228DRAFT_244248 [Xylona heveae TC161]